MSIDMIVQMVKIPVADIERAALFYRDVLGLEEDFIVVAYGWAQFSAGNLPVALYVPGKGGGTGTPGQSDCLHLTTSDADAFRARLTAAEIDPDSHFYTGADHISYFELQDPDGNTIKIMLPDQDDDTP